MPKQLSRTVSIYINGTQVEATLKQLRAEVRLLENEQAKLPIGTQEYINKSMELARLNGVLREQREAVNALNTSWDTATVKLNTVANVIQSIYSIFQMGDMAIGSIKDLAKDAAELDDAYADVMKTTGLTREQVVALNEAFQDLDTRTAREQLNALAYEAGKLGINSTEQVLQFVKAADKINIALGDVLGDGAMVTIGKLADIYSQATDTLASKDLEGKMLAIGSAINSLGQESTANENYMVDFLSRLGGVANQAHLTADAVLGFASALDQNNQAVEMSATAFQKLITQMIKKPEEFVKAAKLPLDQFRQLLETDMNEAILRVLDGFREMGGYTSLVPVFKDMGLDGQRAASAIAALAGSLDKVREAQASARRELESGQSVLTEFATKNNTMAAEAEKAKKRFEDIRLELGEKLYPVVIHFTKSGTAALKGLAGFLNLWKENRVAAIALTTAITGLVAALTKAQIIKLKDKAVTLTKVAAMKVENAVTAQNTALQAKRTAALEKERLATLKAELAEAKKVAMMEVEAADYSALTVKTMAQGRALQLETAITKQQTVATEAATAATKAQSAAFKATPWGAVIAAVSALALGINTLVRHQQRFNREARETAKAIGQESAQATYLFDKLDSLNEKSDEYNSTLKRLNELYPDILAQYTDEEGRLRNVAEARQAVIDGIRQQIVEQRRLDKLSDIEGDYQEKYEKYAQKIQRYLKNQLGESAGQNAFTDLMQALPQTFSDNINDYMQAIDRAVGDNSPVQKHLYGIVRQIIKAQLKAENERKKWESLYSDSRGNTTLNASDFESPPKKSISSIPSIPSTPITDPDDADNSLKKWQTVKQQAEALITDFTNKSKTGLDQLFSEIEARADKARKDVREFAGAKEKVKAELIARIDEAADTYRRAKVDEYLKKYNDEVQRLNQAPSGNEQLDKVRQAAQQLQQQLATLDSQIAALTADLEQKDITDTERQKLEALIARYKELKQLFASTAFNGIDTTVDTSSFALSGDRAKDATNYARLSSEIKRAVEATTALRDLATDPDVRTEYEAQLTELEEQQQAIDEIYAGVDRLANRIERGNTLDKLIENLQFFGDKALDILDSIFQVADNIGQKELNDAAKLRDENTKALDDMLAQNLITEEHYNSEKERLDKEYSDKQKEIELEQWKREKWLNASEAVMASALAILRVWSDAGNGTTAMRAAQTAIVGAATLAQLSAILSEPAPYAKGGYVPRRTVYQAGEQGSEWVASHRLLSDPLTAPVIAALEDYQRGRSLAPAAINTPAVNNAAAMRQRQQATDMALLAEFRRLASYLEDPNNRRAVISRETQDTFDTNENFLRTVSSL